MKCDVCKKIFTNAEPEEYVALFDPAKRRYYSHLSCFLQKFNV